MFGEKLHQEISERVRSFADLADKEARLNELIRIKIMCDILSEFLDEDSHQKRGELSLVSINLLRFTLGEGLEFHSRALHSLGKLISAEWIE